MTWEYYSKVVDDTDQQMNRELNTYGLNGWELVAAYPRWHRPHTVRLVFKRQTED